jgi:FMN phosphatase YigB (HAD superfamily)
VIGTSKFTGRTGVINRMVMRISFDVDDTLVCPDPQVPRETQKVPAILRPWFSESLRLGNKDLLLQLQMSG